MVQQLTEAKTQCFTGADLYGVPAAYVTAEKADGRIIVGYLFAEAGSSVASLFPEAGIEDMQDAYGKVRAELVHRLGVPDGENGADVYWEEEGCVWVLNNARSEAFYVCIHIGVGSYADTGLGLPDAKGSGYGTNL